MIAVLVFDSRAPFTNPDNVAGDGGLALAGVCVVPCRAAVGAPHAAGCHRRRARGHRAPLWTNRRSAP